MIRLYKKGQNIVTKHPTIGNSEDLTNLVWIDLQYPTIEEIVEVESPAFQHQHPNPYASRKRLNQVPVIPKPTIIS